MIKIDGTNTEIQGDAGTVIAEISSVWFGVVELVAKELDVDPDDIRAEIIESGAYLDKRMNGSSHDDAMKELCND